MGLNLRVIWEIKLINVFVFLKAFIYFGEPKKEIASPIVGWTK